MSEETTSWLNVLRTSIRLLTFRSTRDELLKFSWKHLAFGLFCTWLVGIGRYWDNPRVSVLQHLGVGSVIYIFALSLLLYLLVWPLKAKDWTYFRVLTFVSLVSPPAILYAIPVERSFDIDTANSINFMFLTIVAAWRVALLVFFFRRSGALGWFAVITVTLLPLTLIVVSLTVLNLERVVFDLMGGVNPSEKSGNDAAYDFLILLTLLSLIVFPVSFFCYLYLAISKYASSQDKTTKLID
jgi:hypothetical protein